LCTQLGLGGVLYLHGGWQSIVDGLLDVVLRRGVTLSAVQPESVRRRGVPGEPGWRVDFAGGTSVAADAVVLACGGPDAMSSIVELPSQWLECAGPSVRAACLDLGLRGQPARRFVLGVDEPFYLSRHDPPARLSPGGHSLVSVAEYLPSPRVDSTGGGTSGRDVAAGRRRLEDFARRCGIRPDRVVKSRYLHDMVVAHGMPTADRGGLAGRPSVEVPGASGLFAAGDWIGPEGMLADAALASGARAGGLARSAARRLGGVA